MPLTPDAAAVFARLRQRQLRLPKTLAEALGWFRTSGLDTSLQTRRYPNARRVLLALQELERAGLAESYTSHAGTRWRRTKQASGEDSSG